MYLIRRHFPGLLLLLLTASPILFSQSLAFDYVTYDDGTVIEISNEALALLTNPIPAESQLFADDVVNFALQGSQTRATLGISYLLSQRSRQAMAIFAEAISYRLAKTTAFNQLSIEHEGQVLSASLGSVAQYNALFPDSFTQTVLGFQHSLKSFDYILSVTSTSSDSEDESDTVAAVSLQWRF